MKIILTSVGTRGDMEPFLAIGEILKEHGHQVICIFPEQFRHLAEDSGFEFISLGSKFIELLDSPDGRIAMGGGRFGFKKLKAYLKLIAKSTAANKEMIVNQEAGIEALRPDRIVHHAKAVYPVLWSMHNKGKTTLVLPVPFMHYVAGHPHIIFHKNYGEFINKLTYKLANFSLVKSVSYAQKWLINKSKKASSKKILAALSENKVIYTISPTLFPRPDYWKANLKVLGFHERNKTMSWSPSAVLEDFLLLHPKILLVTFGSMINSNPEKNTETILKILERNQIPAIISTCEGGIVKPEGFDNPHIHFVKNIPYDWIFPKMYAVVHHGGSGTTHMALKYGCANLIIPHIVDQYVWNKLIHEKEAGPLGSDISKMTFDNLEPQIIDLMENINYKEHAERLGEAIRKEDYRDEIYREIVD